MTNIDFPQRDFLSICRKALISFVAALCVACGSAPPAPDTGKPYADLPPSEQGREVVIFSLSLLDVGYRFGGKNPEAGLDCSGMVAYVFKHAIGYNISGSAADIAKRGTSISRNQLRPGDLVFFNTLNRSFSHVGIYIGNGDFIHAPSSNGKVRVDSLNNRYFAPRYETARRYF
jgi:Cell wall-associated hydrolases (invasion-associated proteins)